MLLPWIRKKFRQKTTGISAVVFLLANISFVGSDSGEFFLVISFDNAKDIGISRLVMLVR
jgi:hypothetical protein